MPDFNMMILYRIIFANYLLTEYIRLDKFM